MSVTDQDDMQDRRRSYIDPRNGELLLMEWDTHHDGWVPATRTMHAWQEGSSRIYNPIDNPHTFITMPGHIQWPRLHPTEEDDIRVLMARPWIPDGQAMEGLHEDEIEEMDAMQQLLREDPILQTPPRIHRLDILESILRPTLVMEMPMTLLVQPPRQTDSLLAAALLASLAAPPRPPPPAVRPPPFPKHLADQVLAAAEAAGQACAITMEPIQKASAAVTSCGHVFQKEAITHWMQDHDTCPECRQPCAI
jgi:hypothetical protein